MAGKSPLAKVLSTASNLKSMQSQLGNDAGSIADTSKMIDDYKASAGGNAATAVGNSAKIDQGSSPKDKINPKAQYGDRAGEQRIDTKSMTKPLGLKKGASKIKKARIVKVHKGEAVVPASRQKKAAKAGLLKGLSQA
jgi:hypothetical protein